MTDKYRHYGWESSPYSSKTRSYLRYKQIPFQDIYPSIWSMKRVIEKRVGFIVMPIVITPADQTLQDSSEIIDALEESFPQPAVHPTGSTQRLISLLFELYSDEWLPIIAMHTRWNTPENKEHSFWDFGKNALPYLPGFIQREVGKRLAAKMQSYLPILGITEKTIPEIDRWMKRLLDQLDAHFSIHSYLLGERPCLGDFALYGPLYAHVWRDPGSRALIESRENLNHWRKRMLDPDHESGDFLENDRIPDTLDPIIKDIFHSFFPVLQKTLRGVDSYLEENPQSTKIPRSLGELVFQLGDVSEKRKLLTFQQWMCQRPVDFYHSLSASDKENTDRYLREIQVFDEMQIHIRHRLTRKNFRVVPEDG